MTIEPRHPNPFVGLQPIRPPHPLYGRDAEVRELFQVLTTRRIVVLYSPSGAGKSSLVYAGLVPALSEARFDVWPTIRLGADPRQLEGVPPDTNRYTLATLTSLEDEKIPDDRRRTPAELAGMTLATYVDTRPRKKGRQGHPIVLIFDQFEEVLTTDPHLVAEKEAYFAGLAAMLRENQQVCALFVIREDHLGALLRWRAHFPYRLNHTFHLGLLTREAAQGVAEQLAATGGRTFPAAEKLTRDLCKVRAQQPDGSFLEQEGPTVEPFQLQVVCHRVWASLPDEVETIDEAALTGDVSTALSTWYDETVRSIANGSEGAERTIRSWVGSQLIRGGARHTVRRDVGESGGLPNEVIRALLASYLVRAETRGGSEWYELCHDRLVAPVLASNQAWDTAHPDQVAWFQLQARLWDERGRPGRMLLPEETYTRLVADGAPQGLAPMEQEFLDQSRRALFGGLDEEDWKVRAVRRNRALPIFFAGGAALFLFATRVVVRDSTEVISPPVLAGLAVGYLAMGVAFFWWHRRTFARASSRALALGLLTMAALATLNRVLYAIDYERVQALCPPGSVDLLCSAAEGLNVLTSDDTFVVTYDIRPTARTIATEQLIAAALTALAAILNKELRWAWLASVGFAVTTTATHLWPHHGGKFYFLGIAFGFLVLLRHSGATLPGQLERFFQLPIRKRRA